MAADAELVKHMRYKSMYGANEMYWGLGIEEETYFQFTKPIYVASPILRTAHKPERYSVKYFTMYKPAYLEAIAALFPDSLGFVGIPYFVNAHAFNRMDTRGNHMTTYAKVPKTNPQFSGITFYEELVRWTPWFSTPFAKLFDSSCTFDGDSIEFITQRFYKSTVPDVINELCSTKAAVLQHINGFLHARGLHKEKGLLQYPIANPGFTMQHTNPGNITMCNNGTYHMNITLPSLLGSINAEGYPSLVHPEKFMQDHQRYIRLVQWMQPLVIAMYGTPDPLSQVSPLYSKASQRCAISRYIGVCFYDTNAMTPGKIVTMKLSDIRGNTNPFWWYRKYHETSGYRMLDEVGMDICYKKHYLHGAELRFMDWFPESRLGELMEFFVYLADCSLELPSVSEPCMNEFYNDLLVSIHQEGKNAAITPETLHIYETMVGISCKLPMPTVVDIYREISSALKTRYAKGLCASLMLRPRESGCCSSR